MRACLSGLNSDSYAQLLAIPAVSTCTELVLAGETAVSEAAVGVLALLCTTHEGKALAVAAQAQRSFLYIINGSISLPVLTDAVAGLLSMSVNTEGKHAVIRAGAADALAAHLDNPNELLRLQVLQAVASIAEEPSGREQVRLGRDCARQAVSFRRAANSPAARALPRSCCPQGRWCTRWPRPQPPASRCAATRTWRCARSGGLQLALPSSQQRSGLSSFAGGTTDDKMRLRAVHLRVVRSNVAVVSAVRRAPPPRC